MSDDQQKPSEQKAERPHTMTIGGRVDHELEEFRGLMEPPDTFDDGFTWPAFFGALFVALLMVPGALYMSLIAGVGIGQAAQWVTLILFIEVARRANKVLAKAEIFTLFYISGALMAVPSMAAGGYHGGLGVLWSQFFVQSTAAQSQGIIELLPSWFAPKDPDVLELRSLLHWQWLPAVGLAAFTMIIGRLDNMVLGYGLFRLTSDVEQLPFPMAPLGAQGILALAEEQEEEKLSQDIDEEPEKEQTPSSWRWRVFSIGSVIGLCFGAVYLGLPTITGALLGQPITIFPIPFYDLTQKTGDMLPAVAVGIGFDLGHVILGMVLPFFAMLGSFVGLMITFVANPILHHFQLLDSWQVGDNLQATFFKNQVDFYFSFSIGVAIAIALVGFWQVFKGFGELYRFRKEQGKEAADEIMGAPEGRGDIRPLLIFAVYVITTGLYIGVSMMLLTFFDPANPNHQIQWGVLAILLFYGFVYTPIISYVTARLEGIAGQVLNIPMVREASFILSGYRGVAVWFLPIPLHNYGTMTVFYRQCELTGTKFWSIWKSELLLTPIILVGSLAFAHFIWTLAPIPSAQYPFAQEWWEVTAANQSIIFSSTLGGYTIFEEALQGWVILGGGVIGLALFIGLGLLGAPTFFMYGVVRGLNQTLPFAIIPEFVGALIGRYYFRKRLGLVWRQYVPVVAAGFACGMGLIGTLGIGFTFLAKSVFKLPF